MIYFYKVEDIMKKQRIRIRKSLYIVLWTGTLFSLVLCLGIICGIFTKEKIVTKEVEKEIQVVPDNYLFLGDSLTDYFDLETYFPNQPVVNSGVAGNTTDQILAAMKERVYDYNPSKVFLLIGTNDLKNGKSEDQIVENIEKIVKEIQSNRKEATIFIESLYPVNASVGLSAGTRSNETIQNINAKLKEYCKENKLEYIDMYSKLQDEQGNLQAQYTIDGLHLSDAGYKVVSEVLQDYLK